MKVLRSFLVMVVVGLVSPRLWAAAPADQYSYTAQSDTVKDIKSGLTWQRGYSDTQMSWGDADAYCHTRNLGGFASGWRLPTKSELETLVDVSTSNPAIDSTAFPGTPSEPFWTSTLYASSGSGSAWLIYFYDGHSNYYGMPLSYRVRCVR